MEKYWRTRHDQDEEDSDFPSPRSGSTSPLNPNLEDAISRVFEKLEKDYRRGNDFSKILHTTSLPWAITGC